LNRKTVQNPENGKRQTVYVLKLRNNMTLLEMVESTRNFKHNYNEFISCITTADDAPVDTEELAKDGDEPGQQEP